jgi:hypothetical protein
MPDGAPERWHDALTDTPVASLNADALFARLPAALLVGAPKGV